MLIRDEAVLATRLLCRVIVSVPIDSSILDVLIGDAEQRLSDCLRRRDALLNLKPSSPRLAEVVKRGDAAIAFIRAQLDELNAELAMARASEGKFGDPTRMSGCDSVGRQEGPGS